MMTKASREDQRIRWKWRNTCPETNMLFSKTLLLRKKIGWKPTIARKGKYLNL